MRVSTITIKPGSGVLPPGRLQAGQVVPVEVLSSKGEPVTVRVAGQIFPASGELPQAPAFFWARVESVSTDLLHLRRLAGAPEEAAQLASIARLLDLPAGTDTEKLLAEMLKWRLPLERAPAHRLLAEGRNLPPEERDSFWPARVWLETLTLHTDASKVRLALNYLLGRPDAAPQGQEALNQTLPLAPGQEMVSFFTFKNEALSGELFIMDEGAGKKTDRSFPQKLVVRVHSPVLQETWVYLARNPSGFTARVAVAEERFIRPVQETINVLRERLSALGYQLGEIHVSAQQAGSVCELLRPAGPVTYRPLNITV